MFTSTDPTFTDDPTDFGNKILQTLGSLTIFAIDPNISEKVLTVGLGMSFTDIVGTPLEEMVTFQVSIYSCTLSPQF
mgnify:CR=1 FL=1